MAACFVLGRASAWMAPTSLRPNLATRLALMSATTSTRGYISAAGLRYNQLWHQSSIASCDSTRRCRFSVYMSTVDDEESVDTSDQKTLSSKWNIPGLKKEVQRIVLRCHKKIGKANERLEKARQQVAALTDPSSQASLEDLENCPDTELYETELAELQERLHGLNSLDEKLQSIRGKSAVLPNDVAMLALSLGVNDQPPPRPPRGSPKPKNAPQSSGPRKPYRRYYTENKTEIRVGKRASDNDDLTMNPEHRDSRDWWMHASGCPGSHVVIRCTEENLAQDVIMDAAALAARQSKCQGSVIKVSLTRCRDIKKPPGAKPGLVMLTGTVKTVSVNMKEAEKRLKRLDETVIF